MSELAKSLIGFQSAMPAVKKSGYNPHFRNKFVTLTDLISVVLGASNFNLGFTQEIDFADGTIFVRTTMIHTSGETRESRTPVLTKDATNPQAMGSAISYAKRYGLQAMFGIPADDDDDGTAANKAPSASHSPRSGAVAPQGSSLAPVGAATLDDRINSAKTEQDLLALFNEVKPTDNPTIQKFSARKKEIANV